MSEVTEIIEDIENNIMDFNFNEITLPKKSNTIIKRSEQTSTRMDTEEIQELDSPRFLVTHRSNDDSLKKTKS